MCSPTNRRAPARTRTLLIVLLAALALSAGLSAATIPVTTDLDTDQADALCSLREAIVAANTDASYHGCPAGDGDDRIVFALTPFDFLPIASDLPVITESLAIRGPGEPGDLDISGGQLARLFVFDAPGGFMLLEGLTVSYGRADGSGLNQGGGLAVPVGAWVRVERVTFQYNSSLGFAGAIYLLGSATQRGRLEVRESTFWENQAEMSGGAIFAIASDLSIVGSTLAYNLAGDDGGALATTNSELRIERSTLSQNAADDVGGAISCLASSTTLPATLALVDSTVTGNVGDADANGVGYAGGLALYLTPAGSAFELELVNSVVAANLHANSPSIADLSLLGGATLGATGWSLVGSNEGNSLAAGSPNPDGNYVGDPAAPIDPRLDVLGLYGGSTATHRPLLVAGSPLIDKGACPGAAADQRGRGADLGLGRIVDVAQVPDGAGSDGCDIGAVERNAGGATDLAFFADGFETATTLTWSMEAP
jgi:CSLREA domain-containing protein